jgi:glc operon protein GlcG
MAAAEAEATKNNWAMAIIILDSTGHPVMLHKFDNTQYGSIGVAEDKARSALYYRRPTKVFEDLVAQGGIGLRTLALRNASPLEGGIPLIVDGKIIGAIGVSGALSSQDGQVITVSGFKTARACRTVGANRYSPAKIKRSMALNVCLLGECRLSMLI